MLSAILGRHRSALADFEAALAGVRAAGDRVWEARTLNNIAWMRLALGETDAAETATIAALSILDQTGQAAEAAEAVQNLGAVAMARGDLPAALRLYDEAADRFTALGLDEVELAFDRADALLAAGLAEEAVDLTRGRLERGDLDPVRAADLGLRLAQALLAEGDPDASAGGQGRP